MVRMRLGGSVGSMGRYAAPEQRTPRSATAKSGERVRRFRLYVAGALTIAPSEELQTVLAENLADEYGIPLAGQPPQDSHPEMFRRFMRSMGLDETVWDAYEPIEGIKRFQQIHFAMFRGGLVSEMLGAVVFGMESTTPYRHGMVLKGVGKYCERTGETFDTTYFEAHVTGDEEHTVELLEAAEPFIEADPEGIMRGARLSFDARKLFLDSLREVVQGKVEAPTAVSA
jgi:pyrroloquinoline-quinone synthase